MNEVLNKAGRPIIKAYICEPGTIKLYYDDRMYTRVSLTEIQDLCNSMIMAGAITHFSTRHFTDGEITLNYNPLYQKPEIIEQHVDKLISYIEHSAES